MFKLRRAHYYKNIKKISFLSPLGKTTTLIEFLQTFQKIYFSFSRLTVIYKTQLFSCIINKVVLKLLTFKMLFVSTTLFIRQENNCVL